MSNNSSKMVYEAEMEKFSKTDVAKKAVAAGWTDDTECFEDGGFELHLESTNHDHYVMASIRDGYYDYFDAAGLGTDQFDFSKVYVTRNSELQQVEPTMYKHFGQSTVDEAIAAVNKDIEERKAHG